MKRRHTCLYCPATFAKVADHMNHVHTEHDDRIANGKRSKRSWSCWRCATENAADTDTCSCGWVHPMADSMAMAAAR